jgi:predicted amidohydrolase YtcJ
LSRVKEKGRGLEFRLTPRRVEIKPREKRHEYIKRLDKAIETLEGIINSEETEEKTRIQAANALARLISTSYVMIQDIDVENIEEEVENLKKMMKDREEKQDLGYTLEGEDGQTLEWDSEKKEWVPKTEKPKE